MPAADRVSTAVLPTHALTGSLWDEIRTPCSRIDGARGRRDPVGMKALAAALAAATLLAACQSQGPPPAAPGTRTTLKYGAGDGQTRATAVEIRTTSENEAGFLIRDWIKAKYPGYTIRNQELIEQRDRAYSLVTITGPSNSAQRLYFDISSYYRRP
jgi:hypothetical protein